MGVMPIPCPHFKITIVKRSQGQSAVAGAAYQSGERLFSEYDQKTKFYNKKKELVHAEIMLPSHAPPGYADRATLWNAVEAVENQWNSQLARRIVLAFPVEVPKEQYLKMIREFCQEQFVSKGMIADFAIHDKGDGNPHAHILLTLRAMDEHGKWLPKARKVYDLDENGERIQLPSGNWKCHKENTVDWNDQKYAEIWRHSWETITNRYLEAAGRPERVDLRSFERQGIQQIPTVHLGPAAHQMEKRGVETFLGNAELLLSKCRKEGRVTVQKMERKEKSESPPQLYDLTALQRDANRLLGFTAQQTLDYAQSLYEKRLITYPRTDSRFLTEDMAASIPGLVMDTGKAFAVEEPFPIHVQQVINGNKVTDHHALLPTKSMANADLAALPVGERNVLRLIAARLLCAVDEPYCYKCKFLAGSYES